jgi:uncharacterized protein YfaS (alpha-2-macroglobulin family)
MSEPNSIRALLRFLFGSYTPPGFVRAAGAFLRDGGVTRLRDRAIDFASAHKKRCIGLAVLLAVLVEGICVVYFVWPRRPQLLPVEFTVRAPENAVDENEEPQPLGVNFRGSVAPIEMAGKEIITGITITPQIGGTWRWVDDAELLFETAEHWIIGQKYTVSFLDGFFADHVKVDKNFSFTMGDFKLEAGGGEFYIDPEDENIKRVLLTVRTNYPMNSALLEKNISIEPDIKADSGSLKKQAAGFTVRYNQNATEAYIVSEPLGMPAKSIDMIIQIKAGVRSALNEGSGSELRRVSVEVPGMNSFVRVENMSHELVKNDEQKYDQILVLATRGSAEEAELLKNISVYELPVDRPALPGLRKDENHNWSDADEVVPQVLAQSRKLSIEAIPNELRYSALNSYKFSAEPGRSIYIKLNQGIRFYGGYYLAESYQRVFRVKEYPKELAILGEGSILSFTGDKKLTMLSRGVKQVRYNIGRIRPDDLNHLVSQTEGDISAANFSNYGFTQYNITEQYAEEENLPLSSPRDLSYFSFDFSRFLENIPSKNLRYGFFIFTVEGTGGDQEFFDRRLIVVSDLGFFVKSNADKTRDVFVQSIAGGNPVEGAAVSVLGLNGNIIASGRTGPDGLVHLPDLSSYKNDKAPTVYTVSRGEDMSFMTYRSQGRFLDYSSFDVGGVLGASDPKTLRGFIFSDRGIYRPGDEVRLGLAVKSGDWSANLGGTPLEVQVSDPRGQEVFNRRINLKPDGVEEFRFRTQAWSPTGIYTAQVYVTSERGEQNFLLGSETLRVEEFLPDTLNVTAEFLPRPGEGWITPSQLNARVSVRNLFGTAAAGNEVSAQMTLRPGVQYFPEYRDYIFSDPYQAKNSYEKFLGARNTNKDGEADFSLDLGEYEKASYRLSFLAEAFEKGSGRGVLSQAQVFVSPLPYLIGYRADGGLGYMNRNTVRNLSIAAINNKAERTSAALNFTVMELRYVSVLTLQNNGVYKYQSIKKEYPVSSRNITIPASGLTYSLPTGAAGEFVLSIGDKDGIEYNRINFTVTGTANMQRNLNRTAELEIKLDKNDYAAGETVEMQIKAPYAGAGLITVERDKVYAYKWFTSSGETSIQTIDVPASLEGNGYINIQYLRSQSSDEIFMSPLSYGAAAFSVSRANRTNKITLDIPQEARPGRDFEIRYSSERAGKIIVFAVDEGILQLARYETPDPIAFFFRKRALEVRTSQILDMALPRYAIAQSLAAMGGGAGGEMLAANLNPFKRRQNEPVAYWSGIVDSGPQTRTLRYHVPDYFNGTLRVMAVAVSGDTAGSAAESALVRSVHIISPAAPMMAAPGDEFDVSVTVTNNMRGSGANGKIHLQAAANSNLSISGRAGFDLVIDEGGSQTVSIPVKAVNPGAGELRFSASGGGETSNLTSFMSVRPAVPYRVSLNSGVLKNKSATVGIDRNLYDEFHKREVSLSYLPTGFAKGLYFFLEQYPYGCSEQLISATFPFLYPELLRELTVSKAGADEAVYRVIGILQARMKEAGDIGMWTINSESDPYITVYAAHFLYEARNAGFYVPQTMLDRLNRWMRSHASSSAGSFYDLYSRSYAIYMLTLNEEVTTQLIESLKRDIAKNKEAETDLPGLYLAGTYALLQRRADASSLFGRISRNMKKDGSVRYADDLMYNALYLNMLARHFPGQMSLSQSLLESMAECLNAQVYTTMSANYSLMAVNAYLKASPGFENGRYAVQEILKNKQRRPLVTAEAGTLFTADYSADAQSISIENRDQFNLYYQVSAAGFDKNLPSGDIKNGVDVYREFLDADGSVVKEAKMGDLLTVRINVRSLNGVLIQNLAVVDLLPAGLEADIGSLRDKTASGGAWMPDYIDIREDRIVFYGNASSNVASFTYRARAINSGTFTVPPLFAEAMYDKSIWAMRLQEKLKITGR